MKKSTQRRTNVALSSAFLLTALLAGNAGANEAAKGGDTPPVTGHTTGDMVKAAPDKDGRLISLVVLLKEPRKLDEAQLTQLVSKAIGIAPAADTVNKGFLVAKPPYYKIELESGLYVINNIAAPYFENTEKLASEVTDPELRRAVTDHRAWMSVDWAGKEEPANLRATYIDIGKIAAALASPDAMAVYSPEAGQLSAYNDGVAKAMVGNDPLEIFDDASGDSESIAISDNDPEIRAAQEKARKAWPEFARAYETKSGKNFAVIGRIAEGDNAEHLWLSVTSIDADSVHGTLDNAPVALTTLKEGQPLHVKIKDVDDWIYVGSDGVPVGGFTREALMHARDTASKAAR
ncbi:MAG: DUF2314 domain-containing protein [Candidatus Binatia bacterium]